MGKFKKKSSKINLKNKKSKYYKQLDIFKKQIDTCEGNDIRKSNDTKQIEMLGKFIKTGNSLNISPWIVITSSLIAEKSTINIMKYCIENGCPWHKDTTLHIADESDDILMKYCIENGCPWHKDTLLTTIIERDTTLLKYCLDNGCPWPEDIIFKCLDDYNINDNLNFCIENGCPWPENTVEYIQMCYDSDIDLFKCNKLRLKDMYLINVKHRFRTWKRYCKFLKKIMDIKELMMCCNKKLHYLKNKPEINNVIDKKQHINIHTITDSILKYYIYEWKMKVYKKQVKRFYKKKSDGILIDNKYFKSKFYLKERLCKFQHYSFFIVWRLYIDKRNIRKLTRKHQELTKINEELEAIKYDLSDRNKKLEAIENDLNVRNKILDERNQSLYVKLKTKCTDLDKMRTRRKHFCNIEIENKKMKSELNILRDKISELNEESCILEKQCDNKIICGICYEHKMDFVRFNTKNNKCNHIYCEECINLMKPDRCPSCRTDITSVLKIYI